MTSRPPEPWRASALLAAALVPLALASLAIGAEPLPLARVLAAPFVDPDSPTAIIAREIRLPRTLVALLAGASLGLSGAALQGLLHNPLASPGLVGSASGAALGAVAVLYFAGGAFHPQFVPLAGMAGALAATFLVWRLAGRGAGSATLILAGVAINAFAAAGLSLLLNLAPSPFAVQELVLWTLGDLSDRSLADVRLMLPCTLLGWLLLVGAARELDALSLGERTARSLGVETARLRWRVFAGVALCTGAAVASCGMIGFVGLVVPHLLRPFVAYRPAALLVPAALGGAAMVLAADLLVRLIPTAVPLRVGVVTALVGAPFFLHLILAERRVRPG